MTYEHISEPNRPMGPLLEGDQAIVDAVEQVDQGVIAGKLGFIRRETLLNGDDITTVGLRFTSSDLVSFDIVDVSSLVSSQDVTASIGTYTKLINGSSKSNIESASRDYRNYIINDTDPSEMSLDRETNNQIKLEAARYILMAAQRLPLAVSSEATEV